MYSTCLQIKNCAWVWNVSVTAEGGGSTRDLNAFPVGKKIRSPLTIPVGTWDFLWTR